MRDKTSMINNHTCTLALSVPLAPPCLARRKIAVHPVCMADRDPEPVAGGIVMYAYMRQLPPGKRFAPYDSGFAMHCHVMGFRVAFVHSCRISMCSNKKCAS